MPVMGTSSTSAHMNEDEILKSSEKIKQNRIEEQQLTENLQKLLDGDKKLASRPLVIGKTPNAFAICSNTSGIEINTESNLVISKKTIDKAMRLEQRDENDRRTKNSGHFLTEKQIAEALKSLKSPVMVLKGSRDDSLVAITELKDDKGQEIIVPVEFNKKGSIGEINNVTSIYGREEFSDYLKENIIVGNVLAINEEKANEMLPSIGVDFPKANTLISFDNSIAFSTQNVKYPEENKIEQAQSVQMQRSEKLIPFLNAKANTLDSKLESLAEKKATREDKIARNEAKIQRLSDRADRLEDTNQMLSSTFSGVPFLQSIIKRNEEKINEIRTEIIPRREAKIKTHKDKISQIDNRSGVIQHKLDRCLALNTAIRSFSISHNDERRQAFAQAMDKLHMSTINCLTDKHSALMKKSAAITEKYELTTSSVEKINLQNELSSLNSKAKTLENKIEKLAGQHQRFIEKTGVQIDTAMENTANRLSEHIDKGDFSMPAISEAVCEEVFVQPEQQREQDNHLRNTEMTVEENYNSIDGVINNVDADVPQQSEEQLSVAGTDVPQQPENQQNIEEAAVPQKSEEQPSVVETDVPQESEEQPSVDETAVPQQSEEQQSIEEADVPQESEEQPSVDETDVPQQPENQQSIEQADVPQQPENQQSIEEADVPQKSEEQPSVVETDVPQESEEQPSVVETDVPQESEEQPSVDETDVPQQPEEQQSIEEADVPQESEEQPSVDETKATQQENTSDAKDQQIAQLQAELAAERQYSRNQAEKISELAEQALKLQMAHFTILPNEIAEKTIDNLSKQGVQFSTMKRDKDVTSITVEKKDESTLEKAENDAKTAHCAEYINNGYYQSLSPDERFTQRMSADDAKETVENLKKNGIESSAVIYDNSNKPSAVTISTKDKAKITAYSSRKSLAQAAKALKIKQPSNNDKTQNRKRSKNEELS